MLRANLEATVAAVIIGASSLAVLPASSAASDSHHNRHHGASHATGGIPQHNGGDRDPDNNGWPSDGDGTV